VEENSKQTYLGNYLLSFFTRYRDCLTRLVSPWYFIFIPLVVGLIKEIITKCTT